jgi:3-oxoacyl-[acyl-carrier protein] reductase
MRGARRAHPLDPVGRPSDIAGLVAFLCSDDGEWINGQTIAADGGVTMR